MEQILIRRLPAGTKAALAAQAKRNNRSLEAEAREMLIAATRSAPVTIVDLIADPASAEIEFEPERLGLTARSASLLTHTTDHAIPA